MVLLFCIIFAPKFTQHITTMKNQSTFFVSNLRNRILGFFSLFVFVLFSSSSQAYGQELVLNGVDYQIDTIRMFKAVPGCEYWATRMTRVKDGKGRLDAYFLRVDTYVYPNPIVDGCLQVQHATVGDCLVLRDLLTINEETVKIIKQ